MRISSADWFKAGVARQRVGPISLGIAPRACTILSKLLLLLFFLLLLWVVRCFIEATLEHSQAPGAYVQACALLPPPSPLFQRKYRAHRHCPRSIPGAKPANFFILPEQGLTLLTQPKS